MAEWSEHLELNIDGDVYISRRWPLPHPDDYRDEVTALKPEWQSFGVSEVITDPEGAVRRVPLCGSVKSAH